VSELVVVLLGTDHHPFDRLVAWADEVARLRPDLRLIVQHGATRAPEYAEGHDYLPHHELLDLIGAASAVACHGGPGTIMDARGAGHVPVCVPRDPALGEHVDGHQMRFAALAARAGVVTTVDRVDKFHAAIHQLVKASAERGARPVIPPNPAIEAARGLLARELDRLVASARFSSIDRAS
jgi:UDP-N-acetylglucosamine transferase subunit ALG13